MLVNRGSSCVHHDTEGYEHSCFCFGVNSLAGAGDAGAWVLHADVWLVNTGWSGGAYGKGKRMSIAHTRAMVSAAPDGSLAQVPTLTDRVFGLQVPTSCPGVPSDMLTPRNTWQDKDHYDQAARNLAQRFKQNFDKFADQVTDEVRNAGPR